MNKHLIFSCILLFSGSLLMACYAQQTANIVVNHDLPSYNEIVIKFQTTSENIDIDKGNGNIEKIALIALETNGKWKVVKFSPSGKTIKIYDNGFQKFECMRGMITSLDVSNCLKLNYLNCAYNNLTELDVTKNADLVILNCAENQLSSIKLNNNKKLHSIHCDRNNLSKDAIESIYKTLPDRNGMERKGKLAIYRAHRKEKNSYNASTMAIATAKGWEVVTL
jgi:hypothetical protein